MPLSLDASRPMRSCTSTDCPHSWKMKIKTAPGSGTRLEIEVRSAVTHPITLKEGGGMDRWRRTESERGTRKGKNKAGTRRLATARVSERGEPGVNPGRCHMH